MPLPGDPPPSRSQAAQRSVFNFGAMPGQFVKVGSIFPPLGSGDFGDYAGGEKGVEGGAEGGAEERAGGSAAATGDTPSGGSAEGGKAQEPAFKPM